MEKTFFINYVTKICRKCFAWEGFFLKKTHLSFWKFIQLSRI